ncbi:uncharacterized protein PGTG_06389 [Puccinia graminis f. sp. tritici CRL 75-36-700-3]|uniref:Uncharacterized protein n=1 Tax=Puccinia graminis f. sp. tritici (strain CRL 75-36-700-3 / race SCCL) TaxID=418459 RepID=E3K859_PUCGT|nr:uncharacterized protein PGTG_06389 [Puccinia graminis f. sp. tritici CRL 75-36-700-3]EFP80433.1 hypothetical protein PGTG_06389 [Puccinia graminis f. sp. tritici CRL 75-36-700-3]
MDFLSLHSKKESSGEKGAGKSRSWPSWPCLSWCNEIDNQSERLLVELDGCEKVAEVVQTTVTTATFADRHNPTQLKDFDRIPIAAGLWDYSFLVLEGRGSSTPADALNT